jgi:glycosyltransferase involved in cell wall biosynthesis
LSTSRNGRAAVGIVSPSTNGSWLGGLYYLQHLVRAIDCLPDTERLPLRDVWWNEKPQEDPFAEVRSALQAPVTLSLPRSPSARLRRFVRRKLGGYQKPDLADLFHAAEVALLFPLLPCDRCGVPFVCWITDFQYRHLTSYYPEASWQWFESENRRNAESATLVMLMSQDALQDMQAFFPEFAPKARVVRPCSVPTAEWRLEDPAATARRYELPDKFFLVSNQLCVHKNHRTVFEAVRLLRDRGVTVHVVCTGRKADYRDPEFAAKLDAMVAAESLQSQVRFLGAVPRADQIALMRRAVAVIQPSEFEGWGFALADALALGQPALVSDLAVHHEHSGTVRAFLPPRDVEAWAAAMAEVYREGTPGPDTEAEEAADARNQVESRRVGREMVALFREALALGNAGD